MLPTCWKLCRETKACFLFCWLQPETAPSASRIKLTGPNQIYIINYSPGRSVLYSHTLPRCNPIALGGPSCSRDILEVYASDDDDARTANVTAIARPQKKDKGKLSPTRPARRAERHRRWPRSAAAIGMIYRPYNLRADAGRWDC